MTSKKEDFQGKLGRGRTFPKKYWANSFWIYIHMSALQYEPRFARSWKTFLKVFLPNSLPCSTCRSHWLDMTRHIRDSEWNRILESKSSLVSFLHNIHNFINYRVKHQLNQPFRPFTVADYLKKYESKRNKER